MGMFGGGKLYCKAKEGDNFHNTEVENQYTWK